MSIKSTKYKCRASKNMLKDLIISQLEMLKVRLIENLTDIDKYINAIERRMK